MFQKSIIKYMLQKLCKMKVIILAMCLLSFIFLGANQNTNCKYIGFITGWDATRCGCCEGWKIEINGNVFLADSIPNSKEILGSSENREYPIPIYLDFEKPKYCSDRRIIITCIKKR